MAYFRNQQGTVVDDTGAVVTDRARLQEASGNAQGTEAAREALSRLPIYGGNTTIPTIGSTPSVLSSKDYAQKFQEDGQYAEQRYQGLATDPYTSARDRRDSAIDTYDTDLAGAELDASKAYQNDVRRIREQTKRTLASLGSQYSSTADYYTQMYDQLQKQTDRLAEVSVDRRKAYGASSAIYDPLGYTAGITEEQSKWNSEISRIQNEKANAIQRAYDAYQEGQASALATERQNIVDADARMRQAVDQASKRLRDALDIYEKQVETQKQRQVENAQIAASLIVRKYLDQYENGDDASKEKFLDQAFREVGLKTTDYALREAAGAVDQAILDRNKAAYEEESRALDLQGKRAQIASIYDQIFQRSVPSETSIKEARLQSEKDQKAIDNAQEVDRLATELLSFGSGKNLGRRLPEWMRPLSALDTRNFDATVDQLKAILSKDQLSALKGLGAMSDREFATITAAASKLNTGLSRKAFDQELQRIRQSLAPTLGVLELGDDDVAEIDAAIGARKGSASPDFSPELYFK